MSSGSSSQSRGGRRSETSTGSSHSNPKPQKPVAPDIGKLSPKLHS
jgi:hypothetical protein